MNSSQLLQCSKNPIPIKGPAAYNQEIHFQKINGEKKDISKNKGKGREVIEVLFSHTLSVKVAKFSHFLWHL